MVERYSDHISHELGDDDAELAHEPSLHRAQAGTIRGHEVAAPDPRLARSHCSQIVVELPRRLPPLKEELAIWRGFLSQEIDAIMRGEE